MRVFVAGGSVNIDGQLVPKLVVEGHEVAATARSSAKLAEIRSMVADGLAMDSFDPASLKAAAAAVRLQGGRPPGDGFSRLVESSSFRPRVRGPAVCAPR